MKAIPREAGRITYSTEIRKLKKIDFSEYQRAVIIGSILGDGCLCENWSKTNYRLIISHSIIQKEYIEWKYEILKQYVLTEPKVHEGTQSYRLRTISHPYLSELRELFYPNGKKCLPKNVKEFLKNPLTLAVWFMDDGNAVVKKGKLVGMQINSQSFSKKENYFLADSLMSIYGFMPLVEKNKGKSRLAIWKRKDREIFMSVLKPCVIERMKYKLG